jgi:DNA topoisomerase-1
MKLVIVESPAKCQKIQSYLGSDYKVIASMGHIRGLEQDIKAVGIDNNFELKYDFLKEKSQAIANIRSKAKEADEIILAADDDREGEAIAYSIAILLKLDITKTKRAVFHEITKLAILKAISSPRTLDINKINAQQARAALDLMVGFTISPILWKHVASKLSAGRCQTPALKLVCDKEESITNHKSSSSWIIKGTWRQQQLGFSFKADLCDQLEDEESAKNYLDIRSTDLHATIKENTVKPWSEKAPEPFITSTLQQAASSLLRSNPKRTMSAAQHLYEAGLITYMRTDKAVLSEEAQQQILGYIEANYGKEYCGVIGSSTSEAQTSPKRKTAVKADDQKPKAQEAHEAIRPTNILTQKAPDDMEPIEKSLYRLIWQRTVQSCMAAAKGERRQVKFEATEDEPGDWPWKSEWKRTTFLGWRAVNSQNKKEAADEEEAAEEAAAEDSPEAAWISSEKLKPSTQLIWTTLTAEPHETRAPVRYTEATLIRELEKMGIGRPSTFAHLIESIIDKEYVEKKNIEGKQVKLHRYVLNAPREYPQKQTYEKKQGAEKDKMIPTELGQKVAEFSYKHFNDLFAYSFTAAMEKRLDAVAEGEEEWKNVLRDTWDSYKDRYESLQKQKADPATKVVRDAEDLGEYEGVKLERKKGPYGYYLRYGDRNIKCGEKDTRDLLISKIQEVKAAAESGQGVLRIVGDYEFRMGPYGRYMFKRSDTKKKFVKVSEACVIDELTEEDAKDLYVATPAPSAFVSKGTWKGKGQTKTTYKKK